VTPSTRARLRVGILSMVCTAAEEVAVLSGSQHVHGWVLYAIGGINAVMWGLFS
jgi:hypothetical protein